MAVVKYTGVTTSNDLMQKIYDFALANAWTSAQAPVADLDIINKQTSDGNKCCIVSPNGSTHINLRSANGYQIFKRQKLGVDLSTWYTMPAHLDGNGNYVNALPTADNRIFGVGCTASSAYSSGADNWFAQADVPKYKTTDNTGDPVGVGLAMISGLSHDVYLNAITTSTNPVILVSIVTNGVFQHMAFGNVKKSGVWTGGAFLSATANSYTMTPATLTTGTDIQKALSLEPELIPIFSTTSNASTFLRIDMDDAPSRGYIIWASSGAIVSGNAICYTGKQMGMPLRTVGLTGTWVPKVPHWGNFQSQTSSDQGRNANTLNCVTVDLSLMLSVIRDPDGLRVFSPVGVIPDIYFISTYNIAPAKAYTINYPVSGEIHQALPMTRRGGIFGYDGLGVKQE